MNKLELIDAVSSELKTTKKETAAIINCFIDKIKEDVDRGNKVVISNFGTFYKKDIETFKVFNPQNGELMEVSDSVRIYFASSKNWRKQQKNS